MKKNEAVIDYFFFLKLNGFIKCLLKVDRKTIIL